MKGFYNSFNEPQNIVPAAPCASLDLSQLRKTSFDFPISQVLGRENLAEENGTSFRSYKSSDKFQDETLETTDDPMSSDYFVGRSPPPPRRHIPTSFNPAFSSQMAGKYRRPEVTTPAVLKMSGGHQNSFNLRSVKEIHLFQHVFPFPYFNITQSTVFDAILYTDESIVVSAPTGSGKTAVFEMALVRLLMTKEDVEKAKIVYMAPMKALCTERFQDWTRKFQEHGLECLELTGDSELDDLAKLHNVNLVCTTPEKWDSMSRRWKDKKTFFQDICLFLVDEIHTLNDATRGATVEAVISRMKTLHTTSASTIRFIAVSATLPNYLDIAKWLKTPAKPAVAFNIEEKHRPVRLERFVIGYPFKEGSSDFRFDMNLSYKVRGVIETYSHRKPTLVFCSSRKSVIQTAEILAKDMSVLLQRRRMDFTLLQKTAMTVHEPKVKEFLMSGIGIHHAGLLVEDRSNIEDLFRLSQLPVLISTSTLAMGVNLPAHLVIIKSTHFYNMGSVMEYSDMQILQMIGRAGRPQFDTSATAVIMTKASLKNHYQALVSGTQLVESSLHKNLIEHLNAEIVLQTINDISMAVEWMKHTFLYVRVIKNAKHYGLSEGLTKEQVEKRLQDLCLRNLNLLTSLHLVSVEEETYEILPTETGRLMARYCIAFETMKLFHSIDPKQDSISDMLHVVSQCAEFDEIQLRTNEKRILNVLNRDKHKETIRFPLPGKIKTKEMKINCLLQAQLSNLPIQDFSLSQDVSKIFRVGQRVTKCLMELLYQGQNYSLLLNATLIYKALKTKLWYDSRFVSRQLDGIGMAMSLNLANSGYGTFQKLEEANPRDIEVIVNRHPPFGNQLKEAISCLPRYELAVDQLQNYSCDRASVELRIELLNSDRLQEAQPMNKHQSLLIIGDEDNTIVFKWRINDANICQNGAWMRRIDIRRARGGIKLNISLLSLDFVGLDISTEYQPFYTAGWSNATFPPTPASKLKVAMDKVKRKGQSSQVKENDLKRRAKSPNSCNHLCWDKAKCGHECCKYGKQSKQTHFERERQEKMDPYVSKAATTVVNSSSHSDKGQDRKECLPSKQARITLKRFAYVRPKSVSNSEVSCGEPKEEKRAVRPLGGASTDTTHTGSGSHLISPFHATKENCPSASSMGNDVDNFMTTKAYSINEAGELCDDGQEHLYVHSSDEDFCLLTDDSLEDFCCDWNTSNQIECRNNFRIDDAGLKANSHPESSEVINVQLDSSSKSHDPINRSHSGTPRHHFPSLSMTNSPEIISLSSQLSEQFPFQDTVNTLCQQSQPHPIEKSQGSYQSPSCYGLVQAWPRPKNSDSSSNQNTIPPRKPEGTSANHPVKDKKSAKINNISSIFVPGNKVPLSESYTPGKLFEGVFDGIF